MSDEPLVGRVARLEGVVQELRDIVTHLAKHLEMANPDINGIIIHLRTTGKASADE